MITKDNLCDLLLDMGYGEVDTGVYEKKYPDFDCSITVDYNKELIIYPEEKGFQVNDRTTSNFDENENFVVLECVDRLLTKGYRPEHIELERRWKLGHSRKSGKADIYVTDSEGKKCLFIIECKTYGDEYRKELKNIDIDGGQLFSYFAQARSAQWLILYASNFTDKRSYITESICSKDDKNDELLAKKDESIKLYKDASEASDLFDVWCETYGKRYTGDIVFNDNTKPYDIGIKPLTKNRLRDFEEGDKIVNKFEEILRHNNVSDKENAFNRLVALFICKLVDEEEKEDNDIVDFQYKIGTDTYETLQERLQKLHQKGMEKYMKFPMFKKETTDKKYHEDPFRAVNFPIGEDGIMRCPNGKNFYLQYRKNVKGNKYGRQEEVYQCEDCSGCPYAEQCKKTDKNRTVRINRELTAMHQEVIENLESIQGALLRMNRSIQAEGTFGIMKNDRWYKRIVRRGIKSVLLEVFLVSIGHNLYKYHNKQKKVAAAA